MSKKILVLDIETTGFHPRDSIIVEVGIVELDLETGERKILFDKVCYNRRSFLTKQYMEKSWIVQNGYMSLDEIRNGVDFEEIKGEIQEIVDAYPNGVTAYNLIFDITFLKYYGIQFKKLVPCPMVLATKVVKIPSRHPSHGLYKWPSVEESWAYFFPEEEYDEKHRGADDAFHEAKIIHKLYQLKKFEI